MRSFTLGPVFEVFLLIILLGEQIVILIAEYIYWNIVPQMSNAGFKVLWRYTGFQVFVLDSQVIPTFDSFLPLQQQDPTRITVTAAACPVIM